MLCVHCRCNPVFQYSTTLMVVVVRLLKSLSGMECAIVLPALIITAVNKYIYVKKTLCSTTWGRCCPSPTLPDLISPSAKRAWIQPRAAATLGSFYSFVAFRKRASRGTGVTLSLCAGFSELHAQGCVLGPAECALEHTFRRSSSPRSKVSSDPSIHTYCMFKAEMNRPIRLLLFTRKHSVPLYLSVN